MASLCQCSQNRLQRSMFRFKVEEDDVLILQAFLRVAQFSEFCGESSTLDA
jgi:CRISPR/Cas system-associated endoribonuclease Cas2